MRPDCTTPADVEAYLDYVRTQPLLRTDFDVAHTFFERHAARPSLVFEAAKWMSCDGQAWVPDDEEWPTRGLTVAAVLQALPDLTQPAERVEAALWLVDQQPSLGETTTPVWGQIVTDLRILADSDDPRQEHAVIARTAHHVFGLAGDNVRCAMTHAVRDSLENLADSDPVEGMEVALELLERTPAEETEMRCILDKAVMTGLEILTGMNILSAGNTNPTNALEATVRFYPHATNQNAVIGLLALNLGALTERDPFWGMCAAEELFGNASFVTVRDAVLHNGVRGMVRLLPEEACLDDALAWTTRAMVTDEHYREVGLNTMAHTLQTMAEDVPLYGVRGGIRLHRMAAEAPRKIRPDLRKLAVQSVVWGCEGLVAAQHWGRPLVSGLEWLAQHCGRPTGRSAVTVFREVLAQADSGSVAAVFSGGGRLADSIITEELRNRLRNTDNGTTPCIAFEAILARGSVPLVARTIGRTPQQRQETFQRISFGHT